MKVTTITSEELDEKIEAANEAHELKEGTVIRIINAKFNKLGLDLELEKKITRMFPNRDGVLELRDFVNKEKAKLEFIPHEDLRLAFDLLKSHLLIATEQKESFDAYGEIISPQTLDSIDADTTPLNKVKIGSIDVSSGYSIVISGTKIIRGKSTLGICSPPIFFDGYDEDEYEFGDEIKHVTDHLIK